MIRFFVNDIELVLPSDYSIENIDENTLITSNGEYTLDIDFSLIEPVNAKAFKHLNRLNISVIDDDYDAIMIDNGVQKFGKLVTISSTDISVKTQFVSGSSLINYVTGENRKIWELDFGTEDSIDYTRALSSVTSPSYLNKFLCVPIKFSNGKVNNFTVERADMYNGCPINGIENIVLQPYLLYYINRLPELMGFELTTNVLNSDELLKRLFIANRVQSLVYSDALPDMTIREFILAIETTFNVIFNFKSDKTCEIINTKTFLSNKNTVKLNAIDSFVREKSTDVYRFDITKMKYDLNDTGYLRYQVLPEEILNKCQIIEYPSVSAIISALDESKKNKFIIYKATNLNQQYIFCDSPKISVYCRIVPGTTGYLVNVNKFRTEGTSDEKELIMPITPLAYTFDTIKFIFNEDQGGDWEYDSATQIPVVETDIYIPENQTIIEDIELDMKTVPRDDKIRVGIYNGLMKMPVNDADYSEDINCLYPVSFIDINPEFWLTDNDKNSVLSPTYASVFNLWVQNEFKTVALYSLKLVDPDGFFNQYYSENSKFDTSYIYTFSDTHKPEYVAANIFEYNGHNYIPIKFVRSSSKQKAMTTGYFYRMK